MTLCVRMYTHRGWAHWHYINSYNESAHVDSGKTITIFSCAPDGVRSSGLWIFSLMLYQLSHYPVTPFAKKTNHSKSNKMLVFISCLPQIQGSSTSTAVWSYLRSSSSIIVSACTCTCSRTLFTWLCAKQTTSTSTIYFLSSTSRDLPQYGHKQWQSYFGRTFDVYTKLWKFQQQHRYACFV